MADRVHAKSTLVGAAVRAGAFKEFLRLAKAADLTETLRGLGPFTLFAPTDEAFAKLSPDALASLATEEQRDLLRSMLSYHFAEGQVKAERFAGKRMRAVSYEGSSIRIDGRNGLLVDGATVVMPNIFASNGVIHGIDRVIWPPKPLEAPAAKHTPALS